MTIKEKIMQTAATLFLKNGVHGTSINAIITAAGVSNGALFNHFANKDELVLAIYLQYKAEYRDVLQAALTPSDQLRQFLGDYWRVAIEWSLDHPEKKAFLMTFALQPNVKHCMENYRASDYDFLIPKLDKAIADGDIIADNFNYFTFVFTGNTDAIVNYIVYSQATDTKAIITRSFDRFWRQVTDDSQHSQTDLAGTR